MRIAKYKINIKLKIAKSMLQLKYSTINTELCVATNTSVKLV